MPSNGRNYYNNRKNTQGDHGGRGRKRQGSNTWIPSDKWNKMSAKERWEAKNNKNKKQVFSQRYNRYPITKNILMNLNLQSFQ